jgi:hypothetical protein
MKATSELQLVSEFKKIMENRRNYRVMDLETQRVLDAFNTFSHWLLIDLFE